MKKEVKFTIAICAILLLSICITVEYIGAEAKKTSSKVVQKESSVTTEEKGTFTISIEESAPRLHEQKISNIVKQFFPKDLIMEGRKRIEEDVKHHRRVLTADEVDKEINQYLEQHFLEVDLDKEAEIKKTGTPTVQVEEKEIIGLYSVSIIEQSKLIVLKKIEGNYIKQWESKTGGHWGQVEVKDINNDGQKEIITSWSGGAKGYPAIYIYTWDGTTGRLITPGDQAKGLTSIIATSGYEIEDLDGDKVEEVIIHQCILNPDGGPEPIGIEKEIYKWDGVSYKLWKKEQEELYK